MYPVSETFLQAVRGNTRKYYWTGKITTAGGVSSTQAGRILPVPILLRQGLWRSVLMRRQWNCLLICANSTV